MTSRPSLGIQRQPQRSLSSSGLISRPTPHRSLSHHHSPTTISRPDNYVDLTFESSDPAHVHARNNSSKIGRSRLNIEISKDAKSLAALTETSKDGEVGAALRSLPTPRGKPALQLSADHNSLDLFDSENTPTIPSSARGFEKSTSQTPLPLPKRPTQATRPLVQGRKGESGGSGIKRDIRPKPYVLEVPSMAPRYPSHGYADFFPWTGDHPEDQFNDHVIRQGFFDKTQTTQNETGSAKLSISPGLKHKSGLQTLSSLLTNVLTQRRGYGQITSISSFKPPPRVTLTDTKRETWLRDLANPAISLRRLSRTIPHGIRGKVLLEQCLAKNIPIERAIWLAKCVGANEIRAFKRKGFTGSFTLGGEAKWIRDWTIFVEQFVESVIASGEEKDWKARIFYVMRLAANLYSEYLLDREHYLDWVLASLETCHSEKMPIWFLIMQIYWNDLLRFRRYGCRLVTALCAQLQAARESADRDILQPLIDRLVGLLRDVMIQHPESVISSKVWLKFRNNLMSCFASDEDVLHPTLTLIAGRNERLLLPDANEDVSPRRRLILLLDTTLRGPFPPDLPRQCWELVGDWLRLVQTVLDWSTSSYRTGVTKIYVATRLLRTWGNHGVDINDSILIFLSSAIARSGLHKSSLYHIISELARSGHFSISKYMKWLVARGGIHSADDLSNDGPCGTRLLAELPVNGLPESLSRLRRTMLSRASFSTEAEDQMVNECIALLQQKLHDESAPASDTSGSRRADEITFALTASQAVKSQIGSWLRDYVRLRSRQISTSPEREGTEKAAVKPLSTHELTTVRHVLEDIDDYSMLADVLKLVAGSENPHTLACVCDTLNLHYETFTAIGAVGDIFDILLMRFRSLNSDQDSDDFRMLRSLYEFSCKVPEASEISFQLLQELRRSMARPAIDACSPISDHMAEVLHVSEPEFSDEIEKIFSSGTSMDSSTLERIFERIIFQMETSWTKTSQNLSTCAILLKKLDDFDPKKFHDLLITWLTRFLRAPRQCTIAFALAPLIANDCLDFRALLASSETTLAETSKADEPSRSATIACETLFFVLGISRDPDYISDEDAYRLRIKRHSARKELRVNILSMFRRAIEFPTSLDDADAFVDPIMIERSLQATLQEYVLVDLETTCQILLDPLTKHSDPQVSSRLAQLSQNLLSPRVGVSPGNCSISHRIESAFELADDITLPFCLFELRYIFANGNAELTDEMSFSQEKFAALEHAIDHAVKNDNQTWTKLIPQLSPQISRHLCQRAERMFLDLVPSIRSDNGDSSLAAENVGSAAHLLSVIEHTVFSMQEYRDSNLGLQIVEKINDLHQYEVSNVGVPGQAISNAWLPMMVEFVSRHIHIFDGNKSSSEIRARTLLSLSRILIDSQNISFLDAQLLAKIFDVSLILVDDLSEEARLQCVRLLKERRISDPHLEYLFSYSASPMDSFQLRQKTKQIPYPFRRWEILSEPTPNVGDNDTSLSLTLFQARKV